MSTYNKFAYAGYATTRAIKGADMVCKQNMPFLCDLRLEYRKLYKCLPGKLKRLQNCTNRVNPSDNELKFIVRRSCGRKLKFPMMAEEDHRHLFVYVMIKT